MTNLGKYCWEGQQVASEKHSGQTHVCSTHAQLSLPSQEIHQGTRRIGNHAAFHKRWAHLHVLDLLQLHTLRRCGHTANMHSERVRSYMRSLSTSVFACFLCGKRAAHGRTDRLGGRLCERCAPQPRGKQASRGFPTDAIVIAAAIATSITTTTTPSTTTTTALTAKTAAAATIAAAAATATAIFIATNTSLFSATGLCCRCDIQGARASLPTACLAARPKGRRAFGAVTAACTLRRPNRAGDLARNSAGAQKEDRKRPGRRSGGRSGGRSGRRSGGRLGGRSDGRSDGVGWEIGLEAAWGIWFRHWLQEDLAGSSRGSNSGGKAAPTPTTGSRPWMRDELHRTVEEEWEVAWQRKGARR
eukprot:2338122-Pleurochrysis_carterae.AAC.1